MSSCKHIIVLIVFCLMVGPLLYAKKPTHSTAVPQSPERTIEEQQQFLYYFYAAEKLLKQERYEEAKEIIEFCYALNPYDATVNHLMGNYAQQAGNKQAMLQYYKRAYEYEPSEYWYNYNILLVKTDTKELIAEAIRNMQQVAKQNPKDEEVRKVLQQVYNIQKNYTQALLLQDQIDSISGYCEESAINRYRLYNSMKNSEQALKEIERYLEIDPDNYRLQHFRLQLYEQTHQPPKKMIAAYEAVLKYDPYNLQFINNLAWALCMAEEDLHRAEQLSRSTIMREPSNPIYLDTYAWILYKMGDYESALFYIQRAKDNSKAEQQKEINEHHKAILRKCKK